MEVPLNPSRTYNLVCILKNNIELFRCYIYLRGAGINASNLCTQNEVKAIVYNVLVIRIAEQEPKRSSWPR